MIASAIGAAAGIAGSIFGGISASKAMKKAKRQVEAQIKDNQDWYDRRYNEDSTQRADAQRMLTQMRDQMRERTRAAAGTQAVMGGTDESVAAEKEAQNKAIADATAQIAVNGDARRDAIENQYMARRDDLKESLRNIEIGRANAVSQAIQGVGNAAGSFTSLWGQQQAQQQTAG